MLGARRLVVLIGLLAKDRSLLEKVQGTLGDAGNLPAGRRSSPHHWLRSRMPWLSMRCNATGSERHRDDSAWVLSRGCFCMRLLLFASHSCRVVVWRVWCEPVAELAEHPHAASKVLQERKPTQFTAAPCPCCIPQTRGLCSVQPNRIHARVRAHPRITAAATRQLGSARPLPLGGLHY